MFRNKVVSHSETILYVNSWRIKLLPVWNVFYWLLWSDDFHDHKVQYNIWCTYVAIFLMEKKWPQLTKGIDNVNHIKLTLWQVFKCIFPPFFFSSQAQLVSLTAKVCLKQKSRCTLFLLPPKSVIQFLVQRTKHSEQMPFLTVLVSVGIM